MATKVLIRFGVLLAIMTTPLCAADTVRKNLLSDSFVLAGADGRLAESDGRSQFVFELEITDGKATLKAGESLELLPSATLEKMAADAKQRVDANYRLWGKVTRYGDRNFVFPVYFLPLKKAEKASPQQTRPAEPTINARDDVLNIPDEIVAKLQTKDVFDTRQGSTGLELKADSVLADRIGCVAGKGDGRFVFCFDALGRNVQANSLELLPCESLQNAVSQSTKEPRPARFNVAGIVTRYKDKSYLLLQRAIPVYTHGNFDR